LENTIGQRIRQERENKKWTQSDLAKRLNLPDASYISKMENGIRKVSPEELIQLINIFDCTINYMLGYTDVRMPPEAIKEREERNARLAEFELNHSLPEKVGPDKMVQSESNEPDNDLLDEIKQLSPENKNLIKAMVEALKNKDEKAATNDGHNCNELLAAHRDDNPMDDLPKEAMRSMEAAQKAYLDEFKPQK